jgi:hypothetical protein
MNGSPLLLQVSRLSSRTAPVAAVVFLLVMADIFVSGYRESKLLFRALPGTSQAISGELAYPAHTLNDLSYVVPSSRLQLFFTVTQGKLWHGRLEVGPDAQPGEYALQVFVGRTAPDDTLPVYRVQVFPDQRQLNASYKSLVRHYLGLAPLWIALVASILVIAGLAASYYLSARQEQQLAGQDIVPIAKMARTKQGWEIHFALGRRHGIRPQDTLLLLDAQFTPAGRITVDRVEAEHSTALVPLNATIAPTYWLAKAQN